MSDTIRTPRSAMIGEVLQLILIIVLVVIAALTYENNQILKQREAMFQKLSTNQANIEGKLDAYARMKAEARER